jgi:hypothetical protein
VPERYPIIVIWGDDDPDVEHFDVEANSFEEACVTAYREWSVTGWHSLSVHDVTGTAFRSFDLSLPFEKGVDHA